MIDLDEVLDTNVIWSPEEKEREFRKIVEDKQLGQVDDAMVDLTTANLIVRILDNLNQETKNKILSHRASVIIRAAWKYTNTK